MTCKGGSTKFLLFRDAKANLSQLHVHLKNIGCIGGSLHTILEQANSMCYAVWGGKKVKLHPVYEGI